MIWSDRPGVKGNYEKLRNGLMPPYFVRVQTTSDHSRRLGRPDQTVTQHKITF